MLILCENYLWSKNYRFDSWSFVIFHFSPSWESSCRGEGVQLC